MLLLSKWHIGRFKRLLKMNEIDILKNELRKFKLICNLQQNERDILLEALRNRCTSCEYDNIGMLDCSKCETFKVLAKYKKGEEK